MCVCVCMFVVCVCQVNSLFNFQVKLSSGNWSMLHTKLNMACKLTKALSKQRIKNIRRKKRMNIEREREGEGGDAAEVSCVTSCTFY